MSENQEYSPLYVAYLYYFNAERDYYECHEVLEELWMEEARNPLYQGLLQVAVALYHCRNDNWNGGRKLFAQALEKLEHYPAVTLGIHLSRLVEDCRKYLRALHDTPDGELVFYDLNIHYVDAALEQKVRRMEQNPPGRLTSD